jgi:hypothetical protein
MTLQLRDFKLATSAVVVTALLAGTASGCGGSSGATPTPPPPPVQLAVFADPMPSSLTTSNVRDAQEEIVRFDLTSGSLIWAADGRMFAGYPVINSYFVRADQAFQVRFGTKDGERRAYFTETVRGTICDVSVVNGVLMVLPTDVPVPGGG